MKQHLIHRLLTPLVVIALIGMLGCTPHAKMKSSASSAKSSPVHVLPEKQRIEYDYIFYNAQSEKIKGNVDAAAQLFNECMKLDPLNPTAIYELAKIYDHKGDKGKAMELAGIASNLDPSNTWFLYYYADCLVQKSQYSKAAEVFQKLAKLEPGKIDVLYELAEMNLYAHHPNEAIKMYDDIEAKIGVNEEGGIQKVKIFAEQKKYDKAIVELNKLIKHNPNEPKYYGMLGEMYQNNGQNEKAIATFNDLLKVDPSNPFVHISLAQFYYANKDDGKAIGEYAKAFANPKLDIDTKMKILLSYYTITERKTALKDSVIKLCMILQDTHPDDAKAYAIAGDFYYRDKKFVEARDNFRKANARDKTKFVVWNTILIIDGNLNDMESMYVDSKQTIELFPAEPLGYLFRGFACTEKKLYNEAIQSLKEGRELVVDNKPLMTQFYASLGDNYQFANKFTASDSAYEAALALDSNNVSVLNNYAYYLSLRKVNLEKAAAMSKRSVDLQPGINSYLDTYGWILYQNHKFDEAKKWINQALDHGGRDHGVILEHYGDVLFQLGDPLGAVEYWKSAKQKGGATELIDKKIADQKLYEQ